MTIKKANAQEQDGKSIARFYRDLGEPEFRKEESSNVKYRIGINKGRKRSIGTGKNMSWVGFWGCLIGIPW